MTASRLWAVQMFARGLVPSDVLLPCLKRHAVSQLAPSVHRCPDHAPGNVPLEIKTGGEECRVWATIPHGDTKALAASNHHICTHRTRRLNQYAGQKVRSHHHFYTGLVRPIDEPAQRFHAARIIGVLDKNPEDVFGEFHLRFSHPVNANAQVHRPAFHHRPSLREDIFGDHKTVDPGFGILAAAGVEQHGHRLCCRCCFIQQTGIGHFHACQVADHGLEIQQGLQPSLGNLCLIWRVSRIPAGVFQNVTANHTGHFCGAVAHPDVIAEQFVLGGQLVNVLQVSRLSHSLRNIEPVGRQNGLWHRTSNQFF